MRKLFIYCIISLITGVVVFSSCKEEEDNFRSETGNVDPASIESSSFMAYMPLEASTYSGILAKGFGVDSLKVASTGGTFVSGARGWAFQGDTVAKSYVTVPLKSNAFVRKLTEFTISCWINIPDTTKKKISNIILVDGGDNLFGTLSLTIDSLNLNGSVFNTITDSTYQVSVLKSKLKVNNWSHVVFTYDLVTSKLSLYAEGKLLNEVVCLTKVAPKLPMGSLTLSSAMANIYLGAWVQQIKGTATSEMAYFPGKLDEIRIWSKCLSADEVSSLSKAEYALAQIQL